VTTTTSWSEWLRHQLRKRQWKDADLVRGADGKFGSSEVSRWLAGKVIPKIPSIRMVCEVLGIPAVEGMIAAGHVQPEDLGVTVAPAAEIETLTNAELAGELYRLADEIDRRLVPTEPQVSPPVAADGDGHAAPPVRRFPRRAQGQEGEEWAARRTNRPKG
jgi:hypothetical protein